ncbi:conserved hypothetical protein [Candidatus Sulfopaludibacter sp. SbA3]|nr:conserved hypothetical protein [Candidatus Sulfopaludibacter sp. SbA3]
MASERVEFAGWPECYRLSNGTADLVVPPQIGPRVMRYGFIGGQNLFHNFAHALGKAGETQWQNRGGHRLWVAPEHPAISKALDNGPVEVASRDLTLLVRQPVEPESGMAKEMEVTLDPVGTRVTVRHRITNRNARAVRFAPWALSVMRPGGTAIAGFPPRFRHDERLLPTNPLVMWGYTDFSDPRWRFTRRFVLLRQDSAAAVPQKTGLFNEDSWGAYAVNGELFLKRARASAGKEYPDCGCSVEMFTNQHMLELETLGPIGMIEPGEFVEHTEEWSLHHVPDLWRAGDEELGEWFAGIGPGATIDPTG